MKRRRAPKHPSSPAARASRPATVARTFAAAPSVPHESWRAEIAWEQARGTARFTAVAHGAQGGKPAIVGASPWQDWPPRGNAVRAMAGAVARLERELLKAGWMPDGAGAEWYAKRFAWKPAGARAPRPGAPEAAQTPATAERGEPLPSVESVGPAEAVVAPEPRALTPERAGDDVWRCEIGWEAHTLSSRFVVHAWPPHDERARPIAHSRPLKWMFKNDPESRRLQHVDAARDLYASMLKAGWKTAGHGAHWYSARLVWPGPGAPPGLEPDDAPAPVLPPAAPQAPERSGKHDAATAASSEGRQAGSPGSRGTRRQPDAPPVPLRGRFRTP